jgi:hypothetical protein
MTGYCRVCCKALVSVFDMGMMKLSGFPLTDDVLLESPLDLCRCPLCGLVQLRHTVSPDRMFREYWYRSGINEAMRAELKDVVEDAVEHLGYLEEDDVVVDVGANDGTLLSVYPKNVKRVAFEPAENLQEQVSQHCDVLIPDYFPDGGLLAQGSVTLLTSIACFYAVDKPMQFVSAVNDVLSANGIWVVQFQDLAQMLETTAFDDICHEHLFYPSMASVARMLEQFDLAIIDAERREINGGSLRLTIGRRWRKVSPHVLELYVKEKNCESPVALRMFAQHVYEMRLAIRDVIVNQHGTVDLYGASTKGNTLLQFCNLGAGLIRQAWERSPAKIGRRTVTGIPIVSEESGRADPPDMLFVGIWQFREAVIQREAAYLEAGGKLLFPLPTVEIISNGSDGIYEDLRTHPDAPAVG